MPSSLCHSVTRCLPLLILVSTLRALAVAPSGEITGRVVDAQTGEPLLYQRVELWGADGAFLDRDHAHYHDGRYLFQGLATGSYFVTSENTIGFLDELYDDIPCPRGGSRGCDPTTGTPVPVVDGETTAGVDFALAPLGGIAGTVTDAETGAPLSGIEVTIFSLHGSPRGSATTDAAGVYLVERLQPEAYLALARDTSGLHLAELYAGVRCPGGLGVGCEAADGTPVAVEGTVVTTEVDFALATGGAIEGILREELTGGPVDSARVELWSAGGQLLADLRTGDDGRYRFPGLEVGTYFVTMRRSGFGAELYDNVPCPDEIDTVCNIATGTPIAVNKGVTTTGIDFQLSLISGLVGRVTRAATGEPVANVRINTWRSGGVGSTHTGPTGAFFDSLGPGTFFLSTDNHIDLLDEVYDDLPCPNGSAWRGRCDPMAGTPVVVEGPPTEVLEIALEDLTCVRTPTALCLNGGRFRVEIEWQDFAGNRGAGTGMNLTADTGYFWFFSPDNVEVAVKALDACALDPFNNYWVFAAGLTNLAATLTVTDTVTGDVKRWQNPLGRPFQPIRDTAAFATCLGAAFPTPGSLAAGELAARAVRGLDQKWNKADCTSSDTRLCLILGRFAVEAFWKTSPEDAGVAARAVRLTGDTGYFWFFDPANVEVLVKVLNACRVADFNSFWVFAAGLTDIGVTLRVTDTETGETRDYVNPVGAAFEPVQDTDAFATCP